MLPNESNSAEAIFFKHFFDVLIFVYFFYQGIDFGKLFLLAQKMLNVSIKTYLALMCSLVYVTTYLISWFNQRHIAIDLKWISIFLMIDLKMTSFELKHCQNEFIPFSNLFHLLYFIRRLRQIFGNGLVHTSRFAHYDFMFCWTCHHLPD